MKLKRRINLVLLVALSCSNIGLLVWGAIYFVDETVTQQRFILRQAARAMEDILDKTNLEDPVAVVMAVEKLNSGLHFIRSDKNISYCIFLKDGSRLAAFNGCKLTRESFARARLRKDYRFLWDTNWLQYWDFSIIFYGRKVDVAIYKHNDHRELLESMLPFLLVSAVTVIIFTLIASMIIIRRILRPVDEISKAAKEVSKGDLAYRIPVSSEKDREGIEKLKTDLNKTFSTLEKSFNALSDFSSNVAHEIRTPLTILLGNLEVGLRKTRSQEEYQDILTETIETIKKLQHMVEDMLITLRPASAYSENDFTEIDVSDMLTQLVDQFEVFAETKEIELSHEIQNGIFMPAISSLIKRIFLNLIENAIKYTQPGGKVIVSLKMDKNNIVFRVEDNGSGIPYEDQPNIFKRFYRGTTRRDQSHGLGLAMTKQLTKLHNGIVSFESIPEKGSTFTVTFITG